MGNNIIPVYYPIYTQPWTGTPKEFGIVLIILVLWCIGIFCSMKLTDDKFDNPIIGLIAYLLLTGLAFIIFG